MYAILLMADLVCVNYHWEPGLTPDIQIVDPFMGELAVSSLQPTTKTINCVFF